MSRILEPLARVTIYDPVNRKVYNDFSSFHSITTQVGVGGGGSEAAIVYVDPMSMKFFSGENKKDLQDKSVDEVNWFKSLLKAETYVSSPSDPYYRTFYNQLIKAAKDNKFDSAHFIEYNVEEMWICWIDYWGYDPRTDNMGWFAGFTGIITGFTETINRGETIQFKIRVSDFRRILNITPMFADRAKLREEAKQKEYEKIPPKFLEFYKKISDLGETGFWQRFKGKSNYDIVSDLLRWVNLYMIRPTQNFDDSARLFPDYYGIIPKDFQTRNNIFYDRSFWYVPSDKKEAYYYGLDMRRPTKDVIDIDDLMALDFQGRKRSWSSLKVDETLFDDDVVPIQKALITFTSLFQANWETPWSIMEKIAKATMSLLYLDAKGNLIHSFPLYDELPDASWDHPEKDHGPNYIFYPEADGLKTLELTRSEKPRVTMFGVDAGFKSPIEISQDAASAGLRWGSYWDNDYNFKKYGYRPFYGSKLFTDRMGSEVHNALDKYSQAGLRRMNLLCDTGTIICDNRPDLQPGRTIVIPQRQMVYFLESVTQSFQRGVRLTTTLNFSWGRKIGTRIGNPWKDLIGVIDPKKYVVDDYSGENIFKVGAVEPITPKFTSSKYVQIWDTVGPGGNKIQGYFNEQGLGSKVFLDLPENVRREFGGRIYQGLLDKLISAINSSPSIDNITIGRADDDVIFDSTQRSHSLHHAIDIMKINGSPLTVYSTNDDFKAQVDELIGNLESQGLVKIYEEAGNEGLYVYAFNDAYITFEYGCKDHIHLGGPVTDT